MTNKARLLSYIKKQRRNIIISLIFVLLFVISQLSTPYLIGKALDEVNLNHNEQAYWTYLIIAMSLILVGIISNFIFELVVGYLTQSIIKNIRNDIYEKINKTSVEVLYRYSKGELLQLEIGDMENVMNGMFSVFKTLLQGLLAIFITIVLMVMVNWILALGVIILTPLSVVVSKFIAKSNHKYFKKQAELQGDLSTYSLEYLNNLELVKSLNYEDRCLKEFNKKAEILRKQGGIALFSASWVNPSTRLVNNTIYALIGVIGIVFIYVSDISIYLKNVSAVMTIGTLSSFLNYTNQYTKPFNDVSAVISEFEIARSSFARINDFLNTENEVSNGDKDIEKIETIEFKNMSFSYDKDKELITNFNLKINKGDKVAIVGPTGAGKSTLINLLLRYYDPDSGEILVNGISSKNIKREKLLSNFAIVLQDSWIFSKSVLENIKYVKPEASLEEVKEISEKSHANTFINTLPYGYDTKISQNEGLSEGEKQMISISRAMLANRDIVILDEATSNVDTRTEKLINNAFDMMMKDKTSIVIAHRLSTIKKADVIIVLDNGHIVEQGNHKSLLEKKGFYFKLYNSQFK